MFATALGPPMIIIMPHNSSDFGTSLSGITNFFAGASRNGSHNVVGGGMNSLQLSWRHGIWFS